MTLSKPRYTELDLIAYVEGMVSEAMNSGAVDPASGLECFLYALKPDLVAALRAFAALDPVVRERLLTQAKLIQRIPPTVESSGMLAH